MAQSAKQYFEKLMRDAGLDESTITTAITALSHEKVAGNADTLVKTATEDYNAQVGRVRTLEAKVAEYGQWYGTANSEYQRMQAELDQLRSGAGTGTIDTSKFISKDELASTIAGLTKQQAEQYSQVIKQTARLASGHAAQFGEALDVDAVDKIATERNIPLDMAYAEYIRPRQETKAQQDLEARIKREREDAVKEALSRHRLPVDPSPTETAPIYADRSKAPASSHDIDAGLMDVWNSVGRS